MTTEIHIHGPVTVWRPKEKPAKTRWRVWPNECPEDEKDILMRVKVRGAFRTHVAYAVGPTFYDYSGRSIFRDDDFSEDFLYSVRTPDEFEWIPLDELLEGVER